MSDCGSYRLMVMVNNISLDLALLELKGLCDKYTSNHMAQKFFWRFLGPVSIDCSLVTCPLCSCDQIKWWQMRSHNYTKHYDPDNCQLTSLFFRLYSFIMSEKETSQMVMGSLCCCRVARFRSPSFDLVTAAQRNSLWKQGLRCD